MTEQELADLVIDKILVPRRWERVPGNRYDPPGSIRLRRRRDQFSSTDYVWLDPREFLLGWGGGGISPVFDVGSLDCPELEKFRSGFSSIEELRLALEVAGLL